MPSVCRRFSDQSSLSNEFINKNSDSLDKILQQYQNTKVFNILFNKFKIFYRLKLMEL